MDLRLAFFGAARNVTGSCYLLETGGSRLFVDCGIFQERDLTERNWAPFPVPPESIDAVLLTHAHLDHVGRLPRLVREGFRGKVFCTPATADIAEIVLRDAAHIHEEDAAFKKKRHHREGRSGRHPEVPLFTVADAEQAIRRFRTVAYETPFAAGKEIVGTFHDAGHILGSSMITLTVTGDGGTRTVLFSGDVGRWGTPILNDPSLIAEADIVIVESTYGNRLHKDNDTINASLAAAIDRAWRERGKIVIPSFAVERAQELLYRLNELHGAGRIPAIKVFLDSPMAVRVTEVFRRHPELFDAATTELLRKGDHPCDFPGLVLCRTTEESRAINHLKEPAVIIAGSGMCTAGRVKHHLAHTIAHPENAILFVGYQARGTLGRHVLEGASFARIHGVEYPVRARVAKINGFSAHADRDELFRWLSGLKRPPHRVFVTHGEPEAAEGFSTWLSARTGWPCAVPAYLDSFPVD